MSELYFRLGKIEGFTASNLADKKVGYATPIRELLQNSLDASREAKNRQCAINIHIETISKSQIPHISDYEQTLKKAIQTQKQTNSFNANAQRVVAGINETLQQQNITILLFSDNGTGMPPKQINAIFDERSVKGDEGSGGSFGVGHLSGYSLSSLRYVLYATKYKDDNGNAKTLFTGSPILAGHTGDGDKADRGNSGRILAEVPKNEKAPEFVYPESFPQFIRPKMERLDRGTMVAILGLLEDWDEDAEYAIASNFFYAIAHYALNITIHKNGHQREISYEDVERLIANKKEGQRTTGEGILSGRAVHQAWQAVVESKKGNVRNKIKIIKLKNSDNVHVFIKNDNITNSVVVLVRNGMVIARHDSMLSRDIDGLRKDPGFEPFAAVIDVDQTDAPKLFALVKGAENPYHNKLVKNRLNKQEEKELKDLFAELSKEMKKHLTEIKRDSFDLPLFPVPDKAEPKGGGGKRRASGQHEKANPTPPSKKPPKPKKPEPGKGKKRPRPIVISRNLESKNAARYTDEGDKWKVQLRVIPKNQEDPKDEVYLSMCLAEDNDNEETKHYLDFRAVTINGKAMEIPDFVAVEKDGKQSKEPTNKSQVKLGQLRQAKPYNIIAEVEKPGEITGDMKVALQPILGLKQQKKTEE